MSAQGARRIVVKVGTSTLIHANGKLNIRRTEALVAALCDLVNSDHQVVLVSSGAIGVGRSRIAPSEGRPSLAQKQALAAIGQGMLMHLYNKNFAEYGLLNAQVLLTKDDLTHRERYLNARNTVRTLLEMGVVPIINENDTVSVDEIKIGDNDNLAALVALLIDADLTILLTDIDGLYSANPRRDPEAILLSEVQKIDRTIEGMAGGAGSRFGTGGMMTKIEAAKVATSAGIPLVIMSGEDPRRIVDVVDGARIGTYFHAAPAQESQRKHWLRFGSRAKGQITIDDGAAKALAAGGRSLLPVGILDVSGIFGVGDVVDVTDTGGRRIAKGFCNYNAGDVAAIRGLHSDEAAQRLGGNHHDTVIHCDNMVLIDKEEL